MASVLDASDFFLRNIGEKARTTDVAANNQKKLIPTTVLSNRDVAANPIVPKSLTRSKRPPVFLILVIIIESPSGTTAEKKREKRIMKSRDVRKSLAAKIGQMHTAEERDTI